MAISSSPSPPLPLPPSTVPLIINGKDISTNKKFPVLDPHTGHPLWEAYSASESEANAAAEAAEAAFPTWSGMVFLERRNLLNKVADYISENCEELKRLVREETAADEGWAAFDVGVAGEIFREVAARVSGIGGEIPPVNEKGTMALVTKCPYGVVLGIAPWNCAVLLAARSIAYALAGGNTVILKGSELCPRTHYFLANCFRLAGFPPGVVNLVIHAPKDGPLVNGTLIRHPAVKKINFTGSTPVGRIMAEIAGKALKPILLELGGKAPMIVLDDADLKKAAIGAAWGSNGHAGQVCMTTERIIVLKSVAAEFEHVLKATYAEMYPQGTYCPQPAVQVSGADKVKSLLDDAFAKGAKLVTGSKEYADKDGRSIHPTIIKDTQQSDIHYVESFGPTVSLMVVPTVEQAIKMANDTEYGLSSCVWSKDLTKALNVANQIRSGAVHINDSTIHDEPTLPHGGFNASGFGRFGGRWGIDEFMTTKTIRFRV
ncbi:MAG: hypothetical protein M1834_009487 [Cirrosporium novae-zelandiae]|nr:MAG: hypothetical protein M1834_009487 [Cirrosporium novae-zelandiae]